MALSGWDASKKIPLIINHMKVGSTLTDFPVLINLTTTSGITDYDSSIVFDDIGVSSKKIAVEIGNTAVECYVEIERWDVVAELAQLWVKIPSISSSVDTVINLYFDSTHADNTTYIGDIGDSAAQSVWNSAFSSVFHMAQDPSGSGACVLDSTSNGNDGTPTGTMLASDLVDGAIGKAIDFDGVDDAIDCGTGSSLDLTGAAGFTIEAIIKPAGLTGLHNIVAKDISGDRGLVFRQSNAYFALETDGSAQSLSVGTLVSTAFNYIAITQDGTDYSFYLNGSLDQTGARAAAPSTAGALRIGDRDYASYHEWFEGIIEEVRLSKSVIRSADWIATTYDSNIDDLITFDGPIYVSAYHDMTFGIKLGMHHDMSFRGCPIVSAFHNMYFKGYPIVSNHHDMFFASMPELSAFTDMGFSLFKGLSNFHDMGFIITEKEVSGYHDMTLNLLDGNPVSNHHDMYFAGVGQDALNQQITVSASVGGVEINPHYIDLEFNDREIGPSDEVHLAAEDEAILCTYLAELTVTINSESKTLYCERGVTWTKAQPGKIDYVVKANCYCYVTLNDDQLTEEFAPAMASEIITEIAGRYSITVNYQAVDWPIPANVLYANNETALDIIRKISETIGAKLEDVDGVLTISPRHEYSSWEWAVAPVTVVLTEYGDYLNQSNQIVEKPGYNRYLISDQLTPEEVYRLEQESIDDWTKELRVYQVPWDNDDEAEMTHSGGSWVRLEPMGTIENLIKEEQIEIVNGEGKAKYPIYAISKIEYKQTNLGTITHGEDGQLVTSVEGESLVWITYTTKYKKYIAYDQYAESVQFILEGEI